MLLLLMLGQLRLLLLLLLKLRLQVLRLGRVLLRLRRKRRGLRRLPRQLLHGRLRKGILLLLLQGRLREGILLRRENDRLLVLRLLILRERVPALTLVRLHFLKLLFLPRLMTLPRFILVLVLTMLSL